MKRKKITLICCSTDSNITPGSLTQSLIYSILLSYCYFDRDTQNRGVDYHVLMNNNNPNLNAKYEEACKIKQTPAHITKTNGDHRFCWKKRRWTCRRHWLIMMSILSNCGKKRGVEKQILNSFTTVDKKMEIWYGRSKSSWSVYNWYWCGHP